MSAPRLDDFPSLVVFGERLAERAERAAEAGGAAGAARPERAARANGVARPARAEARAGTPAPRRVRPRRALVLALAAVLLLLVAGAAAAATLLVLRGDAIPPFARVDDAATVRPLPGTVRVASVRAADPAAGTPPWAVRVSRGADATACLAVGQADGGRFGLVGLDGRFRTLPVGGSDSCGAAPRPGAPIVVARQFAGRRAADVRTVVAGIGGPELRSVRVTATGGGRSRNLPLSPEGAFVTAYAGAVAERHPLVTLRYGHGRTTVQQLGGSPNDARDLGFGSFETWRTQTYPAGSGVVCVRLLPTPQRRPPSSGPSACGATGRPFFDAATLRSGDHGSGTGRFRGYRFRGGGTFAWGHVPRGSAVALVTGRGLAAAVGHAGARRVALQPAPDGSFAVVLPFGVRPERVRLEIAPPGGEPRTFRGHTGLVFRGSAR